MRLLILLIFCSTFSASTFATDSDKPRLIVLQPTTTELSAETTLSVISWSENFLESANFNTSNQPEILKQSVIEIHQRYRTTIQGKYLVISYAQPTTFLTLAGEVTAVEIVIGLNRADNWASALFTVDHEGRVVAHEKYAALLLPPELAPPATPHANPEHP